MALPVSKLRFNNATHSNTLIVQDNNRVGIGLGAAAHTLDVDGDINFTGTLYGALTSQTITSSATVPGSPSANDFWYNPNDGSFYIYYNDI